ncbi:hypothetical protein VPT02_030 [Vibrio phage VPT02]|nr:hypothetical protein VPT02_030 [Vibrio phage VPT02]
MVDLIEKRLRDELGKAVHSYAAGVAKISRLNLIQAEGTDGLKVSKEAYKAMRELEDAWLAKSALQGELNRCERNLKNYLFEKYM